MTCSRFRNSWATPLASTPTDSSFWDWRSACSSCCRARSASRSAVTSRVTERMWCSPSTSNTTADISPVPRSPLRLRKVPSTLALPLRASSARRAARWSGWAQMPSSREVRPTASSSVQPSSWTKPWLTATYFPSEARLIAMESGLVLNARRKRSSLRRSALRTVARDETSRPRMPTRPPASGTTRASYARLPSGGPRSSYDGDVGAPGAATLNRIEEHRASRLRHRLGEEAAAPSRIEPTAPLVPRDARSPQSGRERRRRVATRGARPEGRADPRPDPPWVGRRAPSLPPRLPGDRRPPPSRRGRHVRAPRW